MMETKKSVVCLLLILVCADSVAEPCAILLHGLARSAGSMEKLMGRLQEADFTVVNVDYPSRKLQIEALAEYAVSQGLQACERAAAHPVHFVTHSLGGILVRQYYLRHSTAGLARVVMLGPPNRGSEVVDKLKDVPGFDLLNGPAGRQLGTLATDVPRSLGPVNFELGVIAGTQSMNLILSTFLPNPDDGKVSVAATRVAGMCGFVALPVMHPFIMKNDQVIQETITFLKTGRFDSEGAEVSC